MTDFTDRYGNALSTRSAAARDAYVEGVDRFLAAAPGVEERFGAAVAADPGFALGHVALARTHQVWGRRDEALSAVADARAASVGLDVREAGHVEILARLIEGRVAGAYDTIRAHLAAHPRDAMIASTCMGVFGLIGFSGEPGREAEQLAFTSWLAPHYGDDWWFLGYHAFAEMEAGRIGPAAATIERSLDGNPRNANAAHILAHLHYENGDGGAGLDYLTGWMADYPKAGLMHCHMSWHMALWALEQGDETAMWAVADADVAPGGAAGPPLNVLTDMASLLYRAELRGARVTLSRWQAVSDYAARFFPKPGLAFADVHAALAHAMAGNGPALEKIVAEARGPAGDMVRVLADAFGRLAAQDWAGAEALLTVAMADHARIGGSRAQRDLIEFAMLGALLRQGKEAEARRLAAIRRPLAAAPGAVRGL